MGHGHECHLWRTQHSTSKLLYSAQYGTNRVNDKVCCQCTEKKRDIYRHHWTISHFVGIRTFISQHVSAVFTCWIEMTIHAKIA